MIPEVVHTRCILVEGRADRDVLVQPVDFPAYRVSSRGGVYRAIVPLIEGHNVIRFNDEVHETIYLPLDLPKLRLAIIVASDSPLVYDDVPGSNPTLEKAIARLRLAGYIWSAYTAQEMSRNGFSQSFALEESMQLDSLTGDTRMTADIHIVKSAYTTAEIRDPSRAQQNKAAGSAGSLFDIVLQALPNEPSRVAALVLDAHWDGQLITGHAALGGGNGTVQLAIFGSHTCFAWPERIQEIEERFTDDKQVDTRYCGIDGEGSRYFSAANVGIGAMMHEVGHLFGCPHQESGVMLRDYVRLHRSLTAVEPVSGHTVGAGVCHWHRLDILRFAGHPSFFVQQKGSISALATLDGLEIRCVAGIRMIEMYEDREFPVSWLEIGQQVAFIRPTAKRMNIIANNMESIKVETKDIQPEHYMGVILFKSPTLGANPGDPQKFLIPPAIRKVIIYSGACIDGIEFDGLFLGKRGGSPTIYTLSQNEYIVGFTIRSGLWIDALGLITNFGPKAVHGSTGGSEYSFISPAGYRVCGVQGECGQWLNKFAMLYTAM